MRQVPKVTLLKKCIAVAVAAYFALGSGLVTAVDAGSGGNSNSDWPSVNPDNPVASLFHKNGQPPFDFSSIKPGEATIAPGPVAVPEPDPGLPTAIQTASEIIESLAPKSLSRSGNKVLSKLDPRVAVLLQHDNNVFLNGHDEQSEQLAIVRPMLHYRHQTRKSALDIDYVLETGRYFDVASEDYTDHHLVGGWDRNLNRHNKFEVQGQYVKSHVRRYLTRTDEFRDALVSNSSDFEDLQIGIGYARGNYLDRSRMELRFNAQSIRLDYSGPDTLVSDRDVLRLTYGYFWNLKRRFAVFVEGQYRSFDYKEQLRDSTQTRIVFGSEIRLRKRISGAARFGYETKDYDHLGRIRGDYNDTVWDVSLTWRPRPNTTIKARSAKDLIEVELTGVALRGIYAIRKNLGIDWTQAWTPRLSTFATVRLYQDDVQGAEREDQLRWFHVGATYEAMQKLNISVDGAFESRKLDFWPDADRALITLKAEYAF